MNRAFLWIWVLPLLVSSCGDGNSTPSLEAFLRTYCAWSSRCDQINVGRCVSPFQGDTGRNWLTENAEAAASTQDCLASATDCDDYAACTDGFELPDCGEADPISCPGDDGGACTGPVCTAVNRVNLCFNGADLELDCAAAHVNCVFQSVTGYFCE